MLHYDALAMTRGLWPIGVALQYVEHYHLERNHQGLGNTLIAGVPAPPGGAIRRRPRMGGLLNYYERAA